MCPDNASPINIDNFPNTQNLSVNKLTICSDNNTINFYNPEVKEKKVKIDLFIMCQTKLVENEWKLPLLHGLHMETDKQSLNIGNITEPK